MSATTDETGVQPDLAKFLPFLRKNGIPISTGYALAAQGKIRVVRLNGRSFVDLHHWRAQLAMLPESPIRKAAA